MITEMDLTQAIMECKGERNPNANTCIKLAAFYTIRNELFGKPEHSFQNVPEYSYSAAQDQKQDVIIDSDTEFARVINGRAQKDIWPVMDELMETIRDMQPRLYHMVMDRLR